MFKNPIPEDDPRAVKARQRYEGWREKLARMRQAIEATEARRQGAADTIQAAASKALDNGELPPFSEMVTEAGGALAVCDAMLPKMRKEYNEEKRRDLSPHPRVIWRPMRLHGAPGGPILAGQYEAHLPGEG